MTATFIYKVIILTVITGGKNGTHVSLGISRFTSSLLKRTLWQWVENDAPKESLAKYEHMPYSANYIRITIKSRKNAQNKTSFAKYVQFLQCLFIINYNLSVLRDPCLKALKIEVQHVETSA